LIDLKILNYFKSKQPFRIFGLSCRNLFFPQEIRVQDNKSIGIEVVNICNCKCIFCAYRLGYRKKVFMATEVFKGIAESAVKIGYKNLDLTPLSGEFFIHNNAAELLKTAKNAGFKHIGTFTNGILLQKHNIEELLKSGLDVLLISFPGFNDKIYEEIFGVKKYREFEKSTIELLETHKKINSDVFIIFEPRTYLTLKQIKTSEFYKSFVSKFVSDKVFIKEPLRVFDSWGGEIRQKDLIKGMKVDRNPLKSIYPLKKVFLCIRLLSIGVLANGDVRLCNCRYDSTIETEKDSLFIDNIKNYRDLEDLIYQNEVKINKIKTDFINGKLPELCKKCPFYMPVRFNQCI
jgi:hypothetical protein